MIRRARIPDAKKIHSLLTLYSRDGLMLPRPLSEIYEHIRDFYVFEDDGEILGTVCLLICWEDLAEVRSLAVDEAAGGRGIGRKLVEICLSEARELGLRRIFALTYKVDFFKKVGFHEIEKSELPHKIWSDCIRCAKFPECDETAVSIELY